MLSPVQFKAPETAAPGADSGSGPEDRAGPGSFAGTMAALSGEPAARASTLLADASSPAIGQALPRDGKDLPDGGLPSESLPPESSPPRLAGNNLPANGLPAVGDSRGLPSDLPTPGCKDVDELAASAPPDGTRIPGAESPKSPVTDPTALPVPAAIELSATKPSAPGPSVTEPSSTVGEPVARTSAAATTTAHPLRAAVPGGGLFASGGSPVTPQVAMELPVGLRRYGQPPGAAMTSTDTAMPRNAVSDFADHATPRPDLPDPRTLQQSAAPAVPASVTRQAWPGLAVSAALQAALQPATPHGEAHERGAVPAVTVAPLQGGLLPTALAATTGALPPPATTDIKLPPGSAGWHDALGDRVLWMAGNKIQNAEIRLNPADLGPLRVQISVDDGTATINFHAHHSLTRDAIEQALPRLRDMLGDQGLSLGNTSVSGHDVKQQQSEAGRHGMAPAIPIDDDSIADIGTVLPVPAAATAGVGLIDMFA